MPIRDHTSPQSQVQKQEKDWFKKANLYEDNLNRFGYMPKGTRGKSWDQRKDLTEPGLNLRDTVFIIDHDKYINRPDAIAYKFYGNAQYWWLIALRNDIKNPFYEFYKGRKLKIPDMVEARRLLGFQ